MCINKQYSIISEYILYLQINIYTYFDTSNLVSKKVRERERERLCVCCFVNVSGKGLKTYGCFQK